MRMTTAFAMVGAYFLAWQGWNAYKARRSAKLFEAEEARAGKADFVTRGAFIEEQIKAEGAPSRLLNVNNFGLNELNGKKAPRNDLA